MTPGTTTRHPRLHAYLLTAAILALSPTALRGHGTDHELIEAATRAISDHPEEAALYLRRAFLHLEHGDWPACLADAERAKRRQPGDPGVDLLRGRALAAGGRFPEARTVLDRFVAAHPDHPVALLNRARVRAALEQPREAAADFAAAIALLPRPEPDLVFELVALLVRAGRPLDALAALDTALRTTPGQPVLVDRAVEIEMELGRPDAALRRMEEAIRTVRVPEPWLVKRASLLARAGLTRDSITAWREVQARVAARSPDARQSHAMSAVADQAHRAIAALQTDASRDLPPPPTVATLPLSRHAGPVAPATAPSESPTAASGSGTLTRGPYLNQASASGIVVRWRSSDPVIGLVRFGTSFANLNQSATESSATTEHFVTLTGLAPYQRYYYSVGSALDTLAGGDAEHTFRTSPAPGTATNTRIWVLGDAGRADGNQEAVRDAYATWTGSRTADFCLMLGDNAYNSGTDSEYQAAVFDMYPAFLRKMPLWSCLGNHDADGGSMSSTENFPYFDMFTFPTNAECGGVASGTERYFSFDYGNIHFINLDSQTSSRDTLEANGADGPMAAWLRSDLAGITSRWIVAFFHHPPYSKGSHDSDNETQLIEMRTNFGPILEAGGVDLVLSGHSHCYERSFLLDGHYGDSSTFTTAHQKQAGNGRPASDGAYLKPLTGPRDHFGAVYTVTGSAGSASGGALDHPAMYVSYDTLGSFNLDLNGNRLDATYVEASGNVTDTFTILKQGAADSDGDGVADAFELAHGMNRFDPADAALDPDGDGNPALAEYLFGLNPDAFDRYGWTTARNPATGLVEVTFPTLSQRTYQVLWSSNLLVWNPGSAVFTGNGTTRVWIDPGSAPGVTPKRFYRVRVKNGP